MRHVQVRSKLRLVFNACERMPVHQNFSVWFPIHSQHLYSRHLQLGHGLMLHRWCDTSYQNPSQSFHRPEIWEIVFLGRSDNMPPSQSNLVSFQDKSTNTLNDVVLLVCVILASRSLRVIDGSCITLCRTWQMSNSHFNNEFCLCMQSCVSALWLLSEPNLWSKEVLTPTV